MDIQTLPAILPTKVDQGQAQGIRFRVEGELVPVLTMELDGSMPVYFEHHVVLWKNPGLDIGLHPMKGAFKRVVAGMNIFMTAARGPGQIAFSRDGAGHVWGMHLAHGQAIDVREHQFLAATGMIDYTFTRVKGVANILLGGTGFFIDTFTAARGEGVVWLHGYGNVFELSLQAGEQIDIEPGGWVYKERSVKMETQFQKLSTGLFASAGQLVWNRFTGPGRVGVQSMYLHMPTAE